MLYRYREEDFRVELYSMLVQVEKLTLASRKIT